MNFLKIYLLKNLEYQVDQKLPKRRFQKKKEILQIIRKNIVRILKGQKINKTQKI